MGIRADIKKHVADNLAGIVAPNPVDGGPGVYHGFVDAGAKYPYVVFNVPDLDPDGPMDSGRNIYTWTFEFKCIGDNPVKVEVVSDALIQALDGITEVEIGDSHIMNIGLQGGGDDPVFPPEGDEFPRWITTQTYLVQHRREPPVRTF